MLRPRKFAEHTYDEKGVAMDVPRHCLLPWQEFFDELGAELTPGYDWVRIFESQAPTQHRTPQLHHPHHPHHSPHRDTLTCWWTTVQLNRLGRFKDKKRGMLKAPPKQKTVVEPSTDGKHREFAIYKPSTWFKVAGVPCKDDGNYWRVRFIAWAMNNHVHHVQPFVACVH